MVSPTIRTTAHTSFLDITRVRLLWWDCPFPHPPPRLCVVHPLQFSIAFFFHHVSPFAFLALVKPSMHQRTSSMFNVQHSHSHYPTLSLSNNQDSLSSCLGRNIVAPPFRLGDFHTVTLSHFVPHEQPWRIVWLSRWEHCCPSLSTWRYSLRLCTPLLTGQVTVFARSRSEGRRFWSCAPFLPLRCRPLRTMRPSSPTVCTELQWGELRR